MKIENIKTIIIGALVLIVLALLLCMQCTNQNNKYLKNNIKALTDSINVVEMKNGKLLYEKQALILEKDDLQKGLNPMSFHSTLKLQETLEITKIFHKGWNHEKNTYLYI